MTTQLSVKRVLMLTMTAVLLAGCREQATPAPTGAPELGATATPTAALTDTPTAILTPTSTPTRTPRPTRTPTRTPTATAEPTKAPTATAEAAQATEPTKASTGTPVASPEVATPTPVPAAGPAQPALVPCDANALYAAMLQARSDMQQMGGLLDRGGGSCEEYMGWYNSLVTSPVYDGVPAEWGGVYGEYVWAVEHVLDSSNTIAFICSGSGGMLTGLDYGVARMGINEAINRLSPAIEAATAIVGPLTATPTTAPSPAPSRPAPVPCDANALYAAMLQARSDMQQMGGLLDRGGGSCEEYMGWYNSLVTSPVYDGVPAEWGGVYGEYVWAVEHVLDSSNTIAFICSGSGGMLTGLDYGVARMGINEAINRLSPAIDAAQAALGQ